MTNSGSGASNSFSEFLSGHLRGTALVSLLIVLPLGSVVQPRIAPAFVAFACIVCIVAQFIAPSGQKWPIRIAPVPKAVSVVLACLFAAILWGAISLSWSLDPRFGLKTVVTAVSGFICAWYLSGQFSLIPHQRLPIVTLIGLVVAAVSLWLALTFFTLVNQHVPIPFMPYDYNRQAILLALLLWPTFYVFGLNRPANFILFLALLVSVWIIMVSQSETAKIGVLIGSIALALCWIAPFMRRIICVSAGVTLLLMPVLVPFLKWLSQNLPAALTTKGHAVHRLGIWEGYASAIHEKPFFGWGIKSDTMLGKTQEVKAFAIEKGFSNDMSSPHNFALELWVNLGLVGVLFIAVGLAMLSFIKPKDRKHEAIFGAFVASAFCMSLTGSSGFQGWLVASFIIPLSLMCAFRAKAQRREVNS